MLPGGAGGGHPGRAVLTYLNFRLGALGWGGVTERESVLMSKAVVHLSFTVPEPRTQVLILGSPELLWSPEGPHVELEGGKCHVAKTHL